MSLLEIIVLAVLQGLTEFLPISSSAHLILVPLLTEWKDQGLAFDVAIHIGSLIAVMLYFRREIQRMTWQWVESVRRRDVSNQDARLAWAVVWGTIPVGLAGLALKGLIEGDMRTDIGGVVMAVSLIVFGLLLGWADWKHRGTRNEYNLTWKDVLIIGCAQAIALIPGTSRSGITITAGLMVGLSREASARFSFLLSIPVIILAGGLMTVDLIRVQTEVDWWSMFLGIVISGISAYLCIHYFLAFIRRIGMQPFVIYRLVLGGILLYIFLPPLLRAAG
ncbi:undecaprenyl-diphosphatase [Alkalilimnicola ehrlichii]|uniref:Undecaprenyl-diphosphatase n=1 Tax=Alkalilimnicola ehrlichii TaxID=351052 RepID=A0A3E0WW63_9GAMM|nr:undecaprenyl-diphosphate phosphatase [Alkalilimnicola ehrlichii]RFA29835.1 undecaprenyl-diphosphatase [Alkalilimnicola ehrlichii]RFA36423.1 undecaprenyl-diphosphatase [Alkalilimnicola ehrlichii]